MGAAMYSKKLMPTIKAPTTRGYLPFLAQRLIDVVGQINLTVEKKAI